VGLDLGDRRIGVAVSDPERRVALPRATLERSGASWPWRALLDVVRDAEATRVVVGDPLRMDGTPGERSRISRQFAEEMAKRSGLPVELQDERLTSVQAGRALAEGARGARRRRADVDRSAAILILQAWLDGRAAREDRAT
jgi:putative Holliday junction resolvase